MNNSEWYTIRNVESVDTPLLVLYPDRIRENIRTLVDSIDRIERLRPHIKTHKSPEVTRMMLEAGIRKFKCATIAEAEMLAAAGAPDVLLAYQPVGPKATRMAMLTKQFSETAFSCLIDNTDSARHLAAAFAATGQIARVYIDLNIGMNRTGIPPARALPLYEACQTIKGITIIGLHAYDGQLRDPDMAVRTQQCNEGFAHVTALQTDIKQRHGEDLNIVAGGTPSFSIHSKRKGVDCSPGTFVYWDKGYEAILTEQHYLHAALVITRVVSKPAPNVICVDLGHKAIAAENPLEKRVFFLNAPDVQPIGQSEEHLVLKTDTPDSYPVGTVLYGVPYHICPTVALHEEPGIVTHQNVTHNWTTKARARRITV